MPTTGTATIARPSNSMNWPGRTTTGIIGFWLVALGVFSLSILGEDRYPACRAANEKVDYGVGLSISENTRTLIESYRQDWRRLCSSKAQAKPSLGQIFVKAKQIE